MKLSENPYFIEGCLLLGVICLGFAAIFVRLAAVPGVVSAFYRLLIATIALTPIWLLRKDRNINKRMLVFAIISGICFGFDLGLWNVSLFHTSAATSTLLIYLAPIWVALSARFFLKEPIGRFQALGTVVAIAGMVVIVGLQNVLKINMGYGNTVAIIASFFYAGYLLFVQLGRTGSGTFTFTTISVISSMITLLIACLVRGEQMTGFPLQSWMYLLALGLFTHVTGWLAINYALGHMKASVVSVTLLGQPVVTAIAAMPFLGESLSANQLVGGVLVLTGIYLVNRSRKPAATLGESTA